MSAALEMPARAPAMGPVERARRVVPVIVAHADQIEAERGLPPAVLDALHGAGLFRTLLPRAARGEEVDLATFAEMIEVLAAADASTAWCVGQGSGCSMAAAYMKPGPVREIWGADSHAVLAWGQGPQNIARVVDGGYRVTGTWNYASGGKHATWLGGHCRVQEPDGTIQMNADGTQAERSLLFRRSCVEWTDVWQVMGLRGTGSDTYSVTDLFVPADFTVVRDTDENRRQTGPLYRFTTTNAYASAFGAVALGAARGALDALVAIARDKTPSASTRAMRDSPVVQAQVAFAEAKLQAARGLLLSTLRSCGETAEAGLPLSLDQRMSIRMAATFATHQAKEVVDAAYHEAGATAIFQSNPLERRFRDVHCVSQQVQARFAHFETIGAHMLGGAPNLRFI